MNVSYQHANPCSGNESFLLRFESEEYQSQPTCVLVDAGAGVVVDDLLADDEYLTAVVLTHAHADHYQSLAANLRDGAPIYTSEATASILETVLDEAQQYAENATNTDTEAVLNALEPISDWASPVEGLRIAPVPAGHSPGAAGFVFQFETDDQDHQQLKTILATGDWTTERVAGYPGFDTVLPVDVGAVFLTGATNDRYREALTESVETICERAVAGSPVLLSTSGLTGVQYAYLLGHLADYLGRSLDIALVGQAAKLYNDLEYEVPRVEAVPTFDNPEELLASGQVTIAGPEVPTEGSSGRLFAAVRDDPSATLVQVVAGDATPVSSARCTTYDFAVVAHPTEETVDTLVKQLDPMQVIITHQRGQSARRYRSKYDAFVWATDDDDQYTIFEDERWVGPPWMSAEGREYVHRNNRSRFLTWLGDGYESDDPIPLPAVKRVDESVDLNAEGLDVAAIERQLQVSEPATSEAGETTQLAAGVTDRSGTSTEGPDGSGNGDVSATDAVPTEAIASITGRLDAIEAQLVGTTLPARVVEAGEGVTMLRLVGETPLTHGETVEVTVRDGETTTGVGDEE